MVKKLSKAISAFLALLLCLSLASCGKEEVGVKTVSAAAGRMLISSASEDAASLHYAKSRDAYSETVATSGLIELKLDRDSNSFAVYDTSSGVLWTSLPVLEDAGGNADSEITSSLVTLKVAGGTDIYMLNSQDNALAYGRAKTETSEKGICFIYDIFSTREAAEKEKPDKTDIGFRVKLNVELADGNMTSRCTYSNITGNKDASIEEIEVLNYFGAYNDMGTDNFLFVPDGCGAIIKTSVYDESFESLSFSVYGGDLCVPEESQARSILACFGVRRGSGAFIALTEKGDAAAGIRAEKATGLTGFNRVYSAYRITPVAYENNTLYVSKTPTVTEISLCYRFLSANNASYAGMASAVREQLIRNGVLSIKTAETSDYLPFFLTLNGVTKKSFAGIRYNKTLTDFDQAYDMVIRMKNKGINNINVNYESVLTGGADQADLKDAKLIRGLGGESKLEELYDYLTAQKMKLYIGIDILSAVKGISSPCGNICGEEGTWAPVNPVVEAAGSDPGVRTLRKISDLKNVIISALSFSKDHSFSGYCIGDAGSVLYSDFSKNGLLRQECSEIMASAVSPLSTSNSVMVDTGNFYMLKNTDAVINLPVTTDIAKSGAYIPVPFMQIILHGFADYSGEPVNTSINEKETMLRCIEYGACPHYIWNYTPIAGDGESDPFYYDNTINAAADFYTRAHEMLNDLRDARITDHYEVEDGVFCTEYDNGAVICVNYTDSDCPVLGASAPAGDFVRIN
ncbi:MAG: hypothetical protein IJM02_04220 [Clostridia bacterium]|nr:hypothetical protein [Clostridia bacterium]